MEPMVRFLEMPVDLLVLAYVCRKVFKGESCSLCSIGERDGQFEQVLGRRELDAYGGSVETLEAALRARGIVS
jgi:hypothetical protein